jgi:hypothetical protein
LIDTRRHVSPADLRLLSSPTFAIFIIDAIDCQAEMPAYGRHLQRYAAIISCFHALMPLFLFLRYLLFHYDAFIDFLHFRLPLMPTDFSPPPRLLPAIRHY